MPKRGRCLTATSPPSIARASSPPATQPLQLLPDIYISHQPAEQIGRSGAEFGLILRATAENDTKGHFWGSYEEEVAIWCEADERVKFHHFNAAQLRAF